MRHMSGGSSGSVTAQQNFIISQSSRPQSFIPFTGDGSAMGTSGSSTPARKPNKHKKATAAYSSAPQGFTSKK
ncbi:hypothetical protein KFE96_12295 [Kordiimonas sp. SCSIO 12603]|uniref:hypothetical protein n=1 Tax=Kordiimonas sp. SCSIO 12603 TaxID=2829596 RepID=UPI0021027984|nr:hypothetical protein [Kordiimonas sp. SCSIO 12603]UTW57616.1 hypothetical protein KFE96_12295 [Kordiimonas sp. SCSIO 12603]